MRAALLVAIAVCSVAVTAADVRAAERPAVVVTSGKEQQFSVALQKFGGNFDAEAYREGMQAALEFSNLFRLIDRKAFLGPTTTEVLSEREDVGCLEWSTIGADIFVEGVQRVEQEQFIAEFAVWDLAGCQRKLSRRYRQASSADPLILAKRMADDIVEVLTGVRGVASTELTFVSKRGGNSEIFVMNADGGNQRAATANRSINNFPSWSPSGDAIIYTSYRSENRPMLYLSTRGRGKPGRILGPLSSKPLYRAVFHPSGRELAVVMSPTGSTEIYRVDLAGKNPRRLTQNRSIEVSPSWSPDGSKLAFVSDRSGSPQIYLMDSDGANVKRLTFNGNYNTNPAWSPDGRWIAYQARVGGQFDIWLIDPEGSVNLPLISHPRSDESPCWSPDSTKIAFSSTRRGSADIYVIDSSGDHLRRLTSSRGDDTSPSWGPYPR
ncbi:MAG: PD40 domain-containing protein [Deltaproteobacteria bacterium]|nr:PD40 domain-containing protein [Deltaproteobacteria bacterium]